LWRKIAGVNVFFVFIVVDRALGKAEGCLRSLTMMAAYFIYFRVEPAMLLVVGYAWIACRYLRLRYSTSFRPNRCSLA
jgi:hypothetical protein